MKSSASAVSLPFIFAPAAEIAPTATPEQLGAGETRRLASRARLTEDEVAERFRQFADLAEGRPNKVEAY